ncbi:MAG: hypothetical protein LBM61_02025 [Prevotellaceae bacterium]|jgi:hypothetical protein|nr:hypothetical protein [Prevotellaceae bacterium]
MNELFATLYGWLKSFYAKNLDEYLLGYNCDTGVYDNPLLYGHVGWLTVGISLVVVCLYYYVLNHPRFNRWWSWVLVLIGCAGINLFVGYFYTVTDYQTGMIGDCLMFTRDTAGGIIAYHIHIADCWMFGVANALMSVLFFIIFSLALKWKSRNCKYTPF